MTAERGSMICIKAEIPQAICEIDDELKAIITVATRFVFGYSEREKIETNSWMRRPAC